MKKCERILSNPFRYAKKLNRPGFLLFCIINFIVAFNAFSHDPRMMYDSAAHYANVIAYSEHRFPQSEESYEYHSPPLAYIVPAVAYRAAEQFHFADRLRSCDVWLCRLVLNLTGNSLINTNLAIAAKVGQLQMIAVSCLSTYYLAKLSATIREDNPAFQSYALLLLGSLPVYYRSMSFVRGEPFLTLWVLILCFHCIKAIKANTWENSTSLVLGLTLGLAALSKEGGLLIGPAVALFLFIYWRSRRIGYLTIARHLAIATSIAIAVASLFYLQYFKQNNGTFRIHNEYYSEYARSFSLANQPIKFYISLSLDELFTDPVRPAFLNQFIPILYSDTFGDYHAHFLVYGWDLNQEQYIFPSKVQLLYIDAYYYRTSSFPPRWLTTNRLTIAPYLGWVNLIALGPVCLFLGALGLGIKSLFSLVTRKNLSIAYPALPALLILFSFAGFLYATIMINTFEGEVIKATYILQVFPLFALLGAEYLLNLQAKSKWLAAVSQWWVVGFALLALPLFFSGYPVWGR